MHLAFITAGKDNILIDEDIEFIARTYLQGLSVWFYHGLRAEGLPAICIDACHAKAALDMAANKTDADGLAHLAQVGFFREVRVKGFDSMLTRTLVVARTRLVRITTELSNPDPRTHEDIRTACSRGQGKHLREECP